MPQLRGLPERHPRPRWHAGHLVQRPGIVEQDTHRRRSAARAQKLIPTRRLPMGWNSSAVLIEGRTLAQVKKAIPDVFAVTDRVVGWEDASSSALHPHAAI